MPCSKVGVRVVSRLCACLAVLVLLVACGSSLEEDIVGDWEEVDGSEQLSLGADGDVMLRYEAMELEGRYEFVASDRMLLDLRGPQVSSDPFEVPVTLDGDTLYVQMPDGRVATYRRADSR